MAGRIDVGFRHQLLQLLLARRRGLRLPCDLGAIIEGVFVRRDHQARELIVRHGAAGKRGGERSASDGDGGKSRHTMFRCQHLVARYQIAFAADGETRSRVVALFFSCGASFNGRERIIGAWLAHR